MAASDPYFEAALAAAQSLQASDRLRIAPRQNLSQGKNNRVVQAFWDGLPAVVKYYGDGFREHPVSAQERRRSEWVCLTHFWPSGVVPRVLDAPAPDVLIMEHFQGPTLAAWLSGSRGSAALEAMAVKMGGAYGRLASAPLGTTVRSFIGSVLRSGRPLTEHVALILEAAERVCSARADFRGADVESLALIRDQLETLLAGPELLYKYDNNTTNVVLRTGEVPGLIDFEQCLPGTRAMMLGALFDCLHDVRPTPNGLTCECRLPWQAFMSGFVREYPEINGISLSTILAGASLNHWVRVHSVGGDLATWVPRLGARFQHYLELRAITG